MAVVKNGVATPFKRSDQAWLPHINKNDLIVTLFARIEAKLGMSSGHLSRTDWSGRRARCASRRTKELQRDAAISSESAGRG